MPASIAHTRLFVQRFKTTPCITFEREGDCPYEDRCMFAHGSDDLRTEEMNIKDGLLSDSAVRKWQRRRRVAAGLPARSVPKNRAKPLEATTEGGDKDEQHDHGDAREVEVVAPSTKTIDPVQCITADRQVQVGTGPSGYRHDPYHLWDESVANVLKSLHAGDTTKAFGSHHDRNLMSTEATM